MVGMGAFVIIGVQDPLRTDLGISATEVGLPLTVYAIAYVILSPLLVAFTGQIGRRRVMTLGLLIFTLAALASALAPTLWTLNGARVLAAAGAGIYTPIAAVVAAGLYPEEQRAKVLAAVFFGLTLAQVIGLPAGSWIAYTFGWRWAFGVVFAMGLPCIWMIWRSVPSGLQFQPVALKDLGAVLAEVPLMIATFFTASFLGAAYVLYSYIALLLSETMGYGRDQVVLVLIFYGAGAVLGNIAGGFMADRLGWKTTLTALCIGQILIMPVFSALPLSAPVVVLACLLWAMVSWSFMAAQQLRLIGLSGPRAPVVLAVNAASIYVGTAIGSAIGALVIGQFGINALGIVGGIFAAIALLHLRYSAKLAPDPAPAS